MVEQASASAVPDATAGMGETVAKMVLDEKTGELVSKSELKKREKKRAADAKKAEKAATAPPKPGKQKNENELNEEELTPNVCVPFFSQFSQDGGACLG